MSTLVEFIEARLAEDEHLARELSTFVGDGVWRESGGGLASGAYEMLASYRAEGSLSSWHLAHIARHDPARVLREVQAKRRIIAEILPAMDEHEEMVAGEWPSGPSNQARVWPSEMLLRFLAAPYSDHPDYSQEWTP